MTWCSSPSSRTTSKASIWLGSRVATMTRPTESGWTPRARSRSASSGGGGSARVLFRVGVGWIYDSAVLGDDPIEQVEPRADALEILQLASGHEDDAAATAPEAFDRFQRRVAHGSVPRQRAVVVGSQREITHA